MREALQISEKPLRAERDFSHIPRRRWPLFPETISRRVMADRALGAVWPWQRRKYPGRYRLLAWLLGDVSVETAEKYRKVPIPKFRALIMADRLEGVARAVLAVVDELRAYAAAPAPEKLTRKIVSPPVE